LKFALTSIPSLPNFTLAASRLRDSTLAAAQLRLKFHQRQLSAHLPRGTFAISDFNPLNFSLDENADAFGFKLFVDYLNCFWSSLAGDRMAMIVTSQPSREKLAPIAANWSPHQSLPEIEVARLGKRLLHL